jgi:hypothetical protein
LGKVNQIPWRQVAAGYKSGAPVMKIEFTKAEVEQIILNYANKATLGQGFNTVSGGSYRDLPSSVIVEKKEVQHDGE